MDRKDYTDLFKEIARNLPGAPWSITRQNEPDNWAGWADIHQQSGVGVCIFIRDDKAEISPIFPKHDDGSDAHHYSYDEKRPDIKVSVARGAKVIAREIESRLLVRCKDKFAETFDRIRQRREAVAEQERAMRPFADILKDIPGMKTTDNTYSYWNTEHGARSEPGALEVKIGSSGYCGFKVEYTSPEMVAAFVKVWIEHYQRANADESDGETKDDDTEPANDAAQKAQPELF